MGLALAAVVVLVIAASGAYLGWDRLDPERLDVPVGGFTIEAAGVSTHVEHWPAARPSGLPPLVLVPGFAESTYVWSRAAPLLAADRDVYAYDVRGYGYTARVGPYTLDADTDQLAGVLSTLHLSRPVVVGHSLGVAIALSLALRDPASVTGVVAANGDGTPYFGDDRSGTGSRGPRVLLVPPVAPAVITAGVRNRGPIRSLVSGQCGPGCPVDDASVDRWRAPFLLPGAVNALVEIAREPLIGLTDPQELQVRVPVGIVFSDGDGSFDRDSATATASRLHTTAVAELSGERHLALLGAPDRFADAVRRVMPRSM
ncbi:pimeloyl-ACP methyl ester carboxylesterase [Pseudonocardia endophytica]|uniref:Pimeloyl-ACP methyl ester carboxylesterase n=1 Tax=Pseudonocardia endophytica TaxID=401976 RepID=A0A4R1HJD0_PSEEN|nr:pimeloyl-ACP methyl ester carboxylesterase [Pseudonocardia endophytica]